MRLLILSFIMMSFIACGESTDAVSKTEAKSEKNNM